MDIAEACKTVRAWEQRFATGATGSVYPGHLANAVPELKRYLEGARGDGKPIRELEIAEHLLMTRECMRWVMPYVLSAESMEATRHRRQRELGSLCSK